MSDMSHMSEPVSRTAGSESLSTQGDGGLLRRAVFWAIAALVFLAACVAMLAPRAAGPGGLLLLLALAGSGLVFLYMMASGRDGGGGRRPRSRSAALAFDALPDAVLLSDAEGGVILANAALERLAQDAGVFGESARPPGFDRLLGAHPGVSAAVFRLSRAAKRGEFARELLPPSPFGADLQERQFELDVTPLEDGVTLWRARPVDGGEAPMGALAPGDVVEDAPIGFFCAHQDGRIAYANRTLRTWLGANADRPDLRVGHFIAGDATKAIARQRTPGAITRSEITLKARDGIASPALVVTSWPEDPDGVSRSVIYARAGGDAPMGVAQAMGAPKISQPGASLDAMFANAPFGVVKLESEAVLEASIGDANPAFLDMTNGRGGPGARFAGLFVIDDDSARRRMAEGKVDARSPVEALIAQPKDSKLPARYVQIYFAPERAGRLTAYVVDVSERKTLETQLSHSQRMRAIGDLASQIAHDMNNRFTSMQGQVDHLKLRHPVGDPSYDLLSELEQNIASATEMVGQILSYARLEIVRPQVIDVPALVSKNSVWLRQMIHRGVTLETDLHRAPAIKMGQSQLEQAILNLVSNASDAMKNAKTLGDDIADVRGVITIRTGLATEAERVRAGAPDDGRDYAIIEVSDTGEGIPPDMLTDIFEPFITSKADGEGTGLGLATVMGVTKQAGGYVDVDSEVGKGAQFRLLFPACDPAEAEAAEAARVEAARMAAIERSMAETDDLSGVDRILFVDDEEGVRRMAVRMLERLGYDVLQASDGIEALDLLEEHSGAIDVLISDVMMPGKNGVEVLEEGAKDLGDAAVILLSGFTEAYFSDVLERHPKVRFLHKPYKLEQLARAVKAAVKVRLTEAH